MVEIGVSPQWLFDKAMVADSSTLYTRLETPADGMHHVYEYVIPVEGRSTRNAPATNCIQRSIKVTGHSREKKPS